ncbi:MAG: DoxX family protein, partial [Terriglobales bacterium]
LGIGVEMIGAIFLVHLPNGFFMNWFGNQKGEGYEYHLLVIAVAAALLLRGAGKFSVDHALSE